MIIQERLAEVVTLGSGAALYPDMAAGMCAMEAAAYIAGEPWSDHPKCVCPVLGAFMRSWNDGLKSNAERDRLLLPLVPKLIGTRGSKALEVRRATMACDWLVRSHTPAWLHLANLGEQAAALEMLPEITDFARCPPLMPALKAARSASAAASAAAWHAARDAASAAARAAAWAASAAASAAAWDAASAAVNAARDAASAAARNVAWHAAWNAVSAAGAASAASAASAAVRAAARDSMKETTTNLQVSAVVLVERMILAKVDAS